jgi:hypothetical protein
MKVPERLDRNMNEKEHGLVQGVWKDSLKRVSLGNAFASSDLFYCKVGMCHPLKTEEEFQRAQQVVQCYPRNYRILRYEGEGWEPCFYSVTTDGVWIGGIIDYITTGKGDIPLPTSM